MTSICRQDKIGIIRQWPQVILVILIALNRNGKWSNVETHIALLAALAISPPIYFVCSSKWNSDKKDKELAAAGPRHVRPSSIHA